MIYINYFTTVKWNRTHMLIKYMYYCYIKNVIYKNTVHIFFLPERKYTKAVKYITAYESMP